MALRLHNATSLRPKMHRRLLPGFQAQSWEVLVISMAVAAAQVMHFAKELVLGEDSPTGLRSLQHSSAPLVSVAERVAERIVQLAVPTAQVGTEHPSCMRLPRKGSIPKPIWHLYGLRPSRRTAHEWIGIEYVCMETGHG